MKVGLRGSRGTKVNDTFVLFHTPDPAVYVQVLNGLSVLVQGGNVAEVCAADVACSAFRIFDDSDANVGDLAREANGALVLAGHEAVEYDGDRRMLRGKAKVSGKVAREPRGARRRVVRRRGGACWARVRGPRGHAAVSRGDFLACCDQRVPGPWRGGQGLCLRHDRSPQRLKGGTQTRFLANDLFVCPPRRLRALPKRHQRGHRPLGRLHRHRGGLACRPRLPDRLA